MNFTGCYFPITTGCSAGCAVRDLDKEENLRLQAEMIVKSIEWWENKVYKLFYEVDSKKEVSESEASGYARQLDCLLNKALVEEKMIDSFNFQVSGYIEEHGLNA